MSKSKAKSNGTGEAVGQADAASLDKVRDILFGKQVRQSEKRFGDIEGRLSREIDLLRKDQKAAAAELRADMEKRLDTLGEALDGEKAERAEQVRAVEAEWSGRIAELEASSEAAHEKLRAEIQEHTQAVRDELVAAETRQATVLEEAMTQLRSELAGRKHLAETLRGLADSLADAE